MQLLWEFQKHVQLRNFHFDTKDKTIRAVLTDDQIWISLSQFQGKVKDRQQIA
jgi:hypothetical protein